MKLITKELEKKIPNTITTREEADPILHCKLFTPWSNWTWYIASMDADGYCFGLVEGHEIELGYFDLNELKEIKGPWGLKIERDMWFEPIRYSELLAKIQKKRGE